MSRLNTCLNICAGHTKVCLDAVTVSGGTDDPPLGRALSVLLT